MKHTFNTVKTKLVTPVRMSYVGGFGQDPTRAIVNEKQFFNCTPSAIRARQAAAPITWYLLQKYFREMVSGDDYHALLVNTYCHKLPSDGLYPNQPIWHCDYARQDDEETKVDLVEDSEAMHWYIILGDKPSVPVPQFIDKHNICLKDEMLKEPSWVEMSKYIDRKIKSGWHTYAFKPFELFSFRGNELYRSSMTTEPVARFAMRVTLYPEGHALRPTGTSYGKERKLQMVYVGC